MIIFWMYCVISSLLLPSSHLLLFIRRQQDSQPVAQPSHPAWRMGFCASSLGSWIHQSPSHWARTKAVRLSLISKGKPCHPESWYELGTTCHPDKMHGTTVFSSSSTKNSSLNKHWVQDTWEQLKQKATELTAWITTKFTRRAEKSKARSPSASRARGFTPRRRRRKGHPEPLCPALTSGHAEGTGKRRPATGLALPTFTPRPGAALGWLWEEPRAWDQPDHVPRLFGRETLALRGRVMR